MIMKPTGKKKRRSLESKVGGSPWIQLWLKPEHPLDCPVKHANAYLSELSPVLIVLQSPQPKESWPVQLSSIFQTAPAPQQLCWTICSCLKSIMIWHICAFACIILSICNRVSSCFPHPNLLRCLSDATSHLMYFLLFNHVGFYPTWIPPANGVFFATKYNIFHQCSILDSQ